ncbi:MAG: Hpt domain-containing protein [Clostridiales bacterium]|nr:Hpt domain-containing protein [Clostridiales bacterium]
MEPAIENALTEAGVRVAAAVERFGGNEALYVKYVRRFPTEPSFQGLQKAMASGDREAARIACHTLKGVSGNLGFTPLYDACVRLLETLRREASGSDAEPFAAVCAAYGRVTDLLGGIA